MNALDYASSHITMKKIIIRFILAVMIISMTGLFGKHTAQARGRYGSLRIGGYTNYGKGSHFIGGYVRSGPALRPRHR